jgi:hypothetical protein
MTRVAAIIACVTVIAGCMRPPYVQPGPSGGAVISNARLGLYTKEVVTKKDPDTFVADDATICRVSPDLYKSTRVHSMVYCNWQ